MFFRCSAILYVLLNSIHRITKHLDCSESVAKTLKQLRSQILHRHQVEKTPTVLPQLHWTTWRGAADSPELIDMPPRGCSLITYWSSRPDMQSICQRVSLARWDKCPPNTLDQAVLIKGGIRAHDHTEAACQVFHTEASLAGNIFHKTKSCRTFSLNFHKLQEFDDRFQGFFFFWLSLNRACSLCCRNCCRFLF